jgi:hypothetical protein
METPSRTTRIFLTITGLLTLIFLGIMSLTFAFISFAALVDMFSTDGSGAIGIFGVLGSAALAWFTGRIIYNTLKR